MIKLFSLALQSVGIQVLGQAFFYILSTHLSRADFGLLSWMNALSALLTAFISAGLEQVVLRRIAAGNATSGWAATAFIVHSALGSVVMLAALAVLRLFFGDAHEGLRLLPLLFCAQAAALIVVPLKLLLNARAQYTPYALIAFCANAGRILTIIFWIKTGRALSIPLAATMLLVFTLAELIATCLYVALSAYRPPLRVPQRGYTRLLREAAPQYLTVLFDIGLARADWILMGLLSSDEQTGLYTFAYRAFEIMRMPVVAAGLLLMPRIAPLLQRADALPESEAKDMRHFFRLEMWAACALALLLNVLWIPVVGRLTNGLYGAANASQVGLLSLCLPLHYAINLMWILAFSARKYAAIARITLITSLVNLSANAALIPLIGGMGAAFAFLAASLLQAILYGRLIGKGIIADGLRAPLLCLSVAATCFAGYSMLPLRPEAGIVAALLVYLLFTVALKQIGRRDISFLKQMLAR